MMVKAKQGCKVPFEDLSGRMITDDAAVEVPNTTYYRRLIMDGSLVECFPECDSNTPGEPGKDKTKKGGGK